MLQKLRVFAIFLFAIQTVQNLLELSNSWPVRWMLKPFEIQIWMPSGGFAIWLNGIAMYIVESTNSSKRIARLALGRLHIRAAISMIMNKSKFKKRFGATISALKQSAVHFECLPVDESFAKFAPVNCRRATLIGECEVAFSECPGWGTL